MMMYNRPAHISAPLESLIYIPPLKSHGQALEEKWGANGGAWGRGAVGAEVERESLVQSSARDESSAVGARGGVWGGGVSPIGGGDWGGDVPFPRTNVSTFKLKKASLGAFRKW